VAVDDDGGRVLSGAEAVWLDEERAEQAEARRVAFWEVLHRLAAEYGVEVVLTPKRSAARWDDRFHPPRLLAATVRFVRPGAASGKRRRKGAAREPGTGAADRR
jgi:hypothetical protein